MTYHIRDAAARGADPAPSVAAAAPGYTRSLPVPRPTERVTAAAGPQPKWHPKKAENFAIYTTPRTRQPEGPQFGPRGRCRAGPRDRCHVVSRAPRTLRRGPPPGGRQRLSLYGWPRTTEYHRGRALARKTKGPLYRRGGVWWVRYQANGERKHPSLAETTKPEAERERERLMAPLAATGEVARRQAVAEAPKTAIEVAHDADVAARPRSPIATACARHP